MAVAGLSGQDKLPASPGPVYNMRLISGLLSVRLTYERSDLWDIYMNQKMGYLMKIA